MTTIADVITQALILINDIRMQEELATNPALFYRRFSAYVKMAITQVNRPLELYEFLQKSYHDPAFGNFIWVSTSQSIGVPTDIDTGMIGYDLCSGTIRSEDGFTNVPFPDFEYEPETGIIHMASQTEEGIEYNFDFYKDGWFDDLTARMQRLLALSTAVIWDEHFTRDWLNMQPKIKDSSFETINEANYIQQTNKRMNDSWVSFNDELRKYEQDCAYRNIIMKNKERFLFV